VTYFFDLHVHSWYSPDAAACPEDIVEAARAAGLHGIAITDHDNCEVHEYCQEAGLSHPSGLPVHDFLVVPGVEVTTAEGHLLCIGTMLPDMAGEPAEKVCEEIRLRGGAAIPAHPFDGWRRGMGKKGMDAIKPCAVEVFNSAVTSHAYNDRAAAYALARRLPGIAGSDAHHASAVGISSTAFEMKTLSVAALVAAIRAGGEPRGAYLPLAEAIKKHFANFFRPSRIPHPDKPPA